MKHQESSVKIYFSNDYGQFKFLKGNRDVNEGKINRMLKVIQDEGYDVLKHAPIIVDDDMRILDGQHRFYVSKQLGRAVFYVKVQGFGLEGVTRINSNSSNWKVKDYLNSYVDLGKLPYIEVARIHKEYGVQPAVAAALVHFGNTGNGGAVNSLFRDGLIELNHLVQAEKILGRCQEFKDYMDNPMVRAMVSAIEQLFDNGKYDHEMMMDKLKQSGARIINVSSKKAVLQEMESIVNYRMKERVAIY